MGLLNFFDVRQTSEEYDISFNFMIHPASTFPARYQREKRTPTVPSIPVELVHCILEVAYFAQGHISEDSSVKSVSDLRPDRQLLRNCALVCKAWRLPAQKLLFRSVSLSSQSDFYSFKQAVSLANVNGEELRNAVVKMTCSLDQNQPDALLQHSFARAVCACPNLYDLTLSLYGFASVPFSNPNETRTRGSCLTLDPDVLDVLRNGPSISSLHVSNWSNNGKCTTDLLGVWSGLKRLSIGGVVPLLDSTTTPEPFGCELSGLQLNFQSQPSYAFFKWMLAGSTNSLRTLEFEREVPLPLFSFLIETYGSRLESLSLPSVATNDVVNVVKQCAYLREFRTEAVSSSMPLHKFFAESKDVALEHLAFGMNGNTTLQPVLEIIRSKDTLKAISVLLWEGGGKHSQIGALKIACAYRGVDLRFTTNVRAFRELVRGDPIPPSSYPRLTSLRNLNYMFRESIRAQS